MFSHYLPPPPPASEKQGEVSQTFLELHSKTVLQHSHEQLM